MTVSEQEIREFTSVLARQNKTMDQLLELSQEKQRMIILNHAEELDKLVQKEGIIVSNLRKLEDVRFQLQSKLADAWQIDTADLNARRILEEVRKASGDGSCLRPRANEAIKESSSLELELLPSLKYEVDHLQRSVLRLKEVNRQNNQLLNLSLEYIEEMQYLLTGDNAGTYSDKGQQTRASATRTGLGILDRKA